MPYDDGGLRSAIDASDGFDRHAHRKMVAEVARIYPHTIEYRSLEEEGTCATFALGLTENAVYRFVASGYRRKIFAGRAFMQWLLTHHLREIEPPVRGCLALYFSGKEWQHVGVVSAPGRIVSQWGTFPVYDHLVLEVPARYGSDLRYFEMPKPADALCLFLEYAKTWGLSDEEIDWIAREASI
jgi:hypothetical protein